MPKKRVRRISHHNKWKNYLIAEEGTFYPYFEKRRFSKGKGISSHLNKRNCSINEWALLCPSQGLTKSIDPFTLYIFVKRWLIWYILPFIISSQLSHIDGILASKISLKLMVFAPFRFIRKKTFSGRHLKPITEVIA